MKLGEIYTQFINEETDNLFYHGSPYNFNKFDFDRIGSGDGLSKFGYGLYFTDTKELAEYYAKELSIGEHRKTGYNLYTVKLYNLNEFYPWEEELPHHIADCVMRKLDKIGKSDDAELMRNEYEEYGQMWTTRSTYEILTHSLGGGKNTSEFLNLCGLSGVIAESIIMKGNIYVTYDDDNIKILDINKLV